MPFRYRKPDVRTLAAVITATWCLGITGCGKTPASDEPSKNASPPAAIAPPSATNQKTEPPPVDPLVARDAALAAAVKTALAADSRLKSFAIDIRAANGAVELFGTVDAKSSQDKAEKIAAAVAGVKSVKNHLVLVSGS